MSTTTLSRQETIQRFAGPVLTGLAVLTALYLLLPYASGYADARIPIFTFAYRLWNNNSGDWEHCYLVPFGVIAMIWYSRKSLLQLAVNGSWVGLTVLLLGLFVYWVGFRADNVYIGYGSFMIVFAGLILWLLGLKWMWALFYPWAFSVFVFPLTFLDNLVAFRLRMVMSEASVAVLNFIGIATVKSGTAILSAPNAVAGLRAGEAFSVDVADPCSGIRSLFALMMVSALYGYFTQNLFWKRAILFFCSIPLAVIGNLARIIMLTIGTIVMGPEVAIGSLEHPTVFHMVAGYLVFVVALGGMLGVNWLLNRDWVGLVEKVRSKNLPPPPGSPGHQSESSTKPRIEDEY